MRFSLAALAVACLLSSVASSAEAQVLSSDNVRLGASIGLGQMLSTDQTGWLGFADPAVAGGVTIGYELIEPLVLETRFLAAKFPARAVDGTVGWAGIGARLEIDTPIDWLTFGPSAHVSIAKTGDIVLPALSLGLRLGVAVTHQFTVGPEVTLERIFYEDGEGRSTDPEALIASVTVVWRPGTIEPQVERVVQTRDRVRVRDRHTTEFVHTPPPPPSPELEAEIGRLLDQALPITRREERRLIPPVLFEFDSTRMLPCGEVALHVALETIAGMDGEVRIEGHADGTGEDDYNAHLSLARAEFVRNWLVEHGIPEEKLRVEAYGETERLADGEQPAIEPLERRVVFRVIQVNVGDTASEARAAPAEEQLVPFTCDVEEGAAP